MIAVTPIEWPATFVASCVHKKKFKLRNVLDVSNDKKRKSKLSLPQPIIHPVTVTAMADRAAGLSAL